MQRDNPGLKQHFHPVYALKRGNCFLFFVVQPFAKGGKVHLSFTCVLTVGTALRLETELAFPAMPGVF